jgi:hypothetical protein
MANNGSNNSNPNVTPLSQVNFTESDLANPSQFVSLLNTHLNNLSQIVNPLVTPGSTFSLSGHLDMQGNKITNVAAATSASDVVTQSVADKSYSAPALKNKLEAGGSSSLISYRQINNVNQRERSSSFLNDIANTSPTANTATISAGSPSGGFVSVTISSGVFHRVDGTIVQFASLTESLPVPGSGENFFYFYIKARSSVLFLYPTAFSSDAWANRVQMSQDGQTLIAMVAIKTTGYDSVNSAAGGTNPTTNIGAGVRLFGRL